MNCPLKRPKQDVHSHRFGKLVKSFGVQIQLFLPQNKFLFKSLANCNKDVHSHRFGKLVRLTSLDVIPCLCCFVYVKVTILILNGQRLQL